MNHERKLIKEVELLVKTVKTNLYSLVQEWKDLQHVFSKPPSACPEIDSYLQPQDEIDDASSVAAEKNISGSAVDTVADLVSNTIATGEGCTSVIDTSSSTGDAVGLDNPVDTVDAAYSDKMDTTNAFSTDELDSLNAGTGNKIMQILGDYKGEGDSEVHNTGMTMSNAPVSIQVSTTTSNSATCHNSLPPRSTKTTDFSLIVQVHKSDLDRLATEALMLKELLPTVLNNFYVSCVHKVPVLEKRLEKMSEEKERLVRECNKLCRQNYALMADCEQERKEQYAAKNETRELQRMLTQQAEYCSSMGSACCMLLWRVSHHEECMHSILSGSKVGEFLQLVGSTLLSFMEAYQESTPPEDTNPEVQFVLALCGTVTNIAASTYGRDFLSNCEDGRGLIDVFCSVITAAPLGHKYCKLRNLILMALYNLSINQKGVQYLISKPKLLSELVRLLQEERDTTNRLHTLRLIQSMVLEPEGSEVTQQTLQTLPFLFIQHLTTDIDPEIQSTALELLRDIASLQEKSPYNTAN